MNAAIVHDLKIGLKLNYKNINEQLLRNSIEKITRDVKLVFSFFQFKFLPGDR